jgi:hypothetical protein
MFNPDAFGLVIILILVLAVLLIPPGPGSMLPAPLPNR